MSSMSTLRDFLAQKRIAVVGVPKTPRTSLEDCCAL